MIPTWLKCVVFLWTFLPIAARRERFTVFCPFCFVIFRVKFIVSRCVFDSKHNVYVLGYVNKLDRQLAKTLRCFPFYLGSFSLGVVSWSVTSSVINNISNFNVIMMTKFYFYKNISNRFRPPSRIYSPIQQNKWMCDFYCVFYWRTLLQWLVTEMSQKCPFLYETQTTKTTKTSSYNTYLLLLTSSLFFLTFYVSLSCKIIRHIVLARHFIKLFLNFEEFDSLSDLKKSYFINVHVMFKLLDDLYGTPQR